MRYLATLKGEEQELEVEELGPHSFRLTLGDEQFDLDLRQVGNSSFSILVGGRSFDFEVAHDNDELVVASRSGATRLTLEDARRRAVRAGRGARSVTGKVELKAMMPGRVVSVLVKPGDEVIEHQGLLIIEAMKMENEIKAPKAGKVTEVRAEAGKTVERGDLLLIIE